MSNIVAIVGRPNVGKSTLFNRFTETRKAIVNEEAGVTRDRNYGKVWWNGVEFSLIDTGGYVVNSDDIFEEEIRKQVMLAMDEADVILFVVDVETGITDMDQAVARILRQQDKPVFLAINKVDNTSRMYDANEFYALGIGEELNCISSINGGGTGDILDQIVAALPKKAEEEDTTEIPRFSIVGRPNVGKSSMLNALIGEDRHIVTDIAGTTRDAIHTRYNKFGLDFILTDTAGLRKKTKVHENLEFYSVIRSVRVIENSDVCILMLDATRGIEAQDVSIFNLIWRNRKGVVVLVNKWDLVEKDTHSTKKFEEEIKRRLAPNTDIPIIFTSTVTKQRIHKALEVATEVFHNRKTRIPTSKLNNVMLEAIEAFPPPSYKGKYIKIKYATQLPTATPTFAFYANLPQYIKDPYRRYVENKLRDEFDLTGIPIQVFFRKK